MTYPGALDNLVDGVDYPVAAHINSLQVAIGSEGPFYQEGRLTLLTATPVTTANQTAKTVVYWTPFLGNRITLHNGTGWINYVATEKSVAVPATTVTPFDIFGYVSGGTLALETLNWTNDTTRATALVMQDGHLVKSGDTTRLYLGTGRTTSSSGQTEDSITNRFLWNYYNRVTRRLYREEATSHDYNTATWRAWNNSASAAQVTFIYGVVEEILQVAMLANVVTTAGDSLPIPAIAINSTSATATSMYSWASPAGDYRILATHSYVPALGYNYVVPIEYSTAGGTAPTFASTAIDVVIRG